MIGGFADSDPPVLSESFHTVVSAPLLCPPPIAFAPSIDPPRNSLRALHPANLDFQKTEISFSLKCQMIRLVNGFANPTDCPIIEYREIFRPPPYSHSISLSPVIFSKRKKGGMERLCKNGARVSKERQRIRGFLSKDREVAGETVR